MNQPWDPAFRYFVLTVTLILTALILWTVRAALQPLLIAALAAYFLSPAVAFFETRVRMPRRVAANLVYFLVLALIIALPFTILPGQLGAIQGIYQDLIQALDRLQSVLAVPRAIGNLRVDLSSLIPPLRANLGGVIVPKPEDALRVIEIGSRNVLWTLVILVTTYYLMTDWERLRAWIIHIAPPAEQPGLEGLYTDIRRVWMGYLGGQIRLIVVLAVLYTVAWILIGLPGAVILGTLAGLLNLIPELGPAAAAILAVIVALVEGSSTLPVSNLWFAVITLGTYLVLNNVKTIWLQPRILGQSVFLHEAIVFVAI
ncbi:MAG: AI-2E family transporter, partial [Bacteroidota bacterium]